MKSFNLRLIPGIIYIAFWIGWCVLDVGKNPPPHGPYPISLPFTMATLLIPIFLLGYFAGKSNSSE